MSTQPFHKNRLLAVFLLIVLFGFVVAGLSSQWLAVTTAAAAPAALNGTIAYTAATNTQIRLIEADGRDDRFVWQVPDSQYDRITGLSWKPDSSQLAFTSTHESACALRRGDLFTIYNNGINLQRVTHGPLCSQLANYPQGTVTVRINNYMDGVVIVYVYAQGAPEVVAVPISPDTSKNVTIPNVADLGNGFTQYVSVTAQGYTWFNPLANADVIPNSTVDAGEIDLLNATKIEDWAAYSPSWRRDGNAISFSVGSVGLYQIAPNPGIGAWGNRIQIGGVDSAASGIAFSPVDNSFLYYEDPYIYHATAGQNSQPQPLVQLDAVFSGLTWFPDGSGFIVSQFSTFLGYGNMYEYRFADSSITPLTDDDNAYSFHPSISPDGQYIAYAYLGAGEDTATLRIRTVDGTQDWPLGVQGEQPQWGITAGQPPAATPTPPVSFTPTNWVYIPYLEK